MSRGERIRELRQALGINQQEMAKAIGVTPQYISAIEQNKRAPSLPFLARLAEELGVTIDHLVTGKDSVITDPIPAINGDKKLKPNAKKALTALIQELYEATGSE